jgi:UDP-2-acetamido-3-amino-2,3-dideoxy-glucuronate N-acetyltransferase
MPLIHHSADVQTENIGKDTYVWQNCVILKGASIGNNCNINCNVFIENDVVVGNNVTVKSGVQLWDGLRIADNVFIGPNATFTNDVVPRSKKYPEIFLQTVICTGASIGANATIKAGVTIGEYAMVGMGSVVTKSILPYTLWFGNPAVQKGYVTMNGEIVGLDLLDKKTGKQYCYVNNKLELAHA